MKSRESVHRSVMSSSLWPCGLQPIRLLCPQNSPGENTEVGSHSLLQGIFSTQRSNPRLLLLLHWEAGSLSQNKEALRTRETEAQRSWASHLGLVSSEVSIQSLTIRHVGWRWIQMRWESPNKEDQKKTKMSSWYLKSSFYWIDRISEKSATSFNWQKTTFPPREKKKLLF